MTAPEPTAPARKEDRRYEVRTVAGRAEMVLELRLASWNIPYGRSIEVDLRDRYGKWPGPTEPDTRRGEWRHMESRIDDMQRDMLNYDDMARAQMGAMVLKLVNDFIERVTDDDLRALGWMAPEPDDERPRVSAEQMERLILELLDKSR